MTDSSFDVTRAPLITSSPVNIESGDEASVSVSSQPNQSDNTTLTLQILRNEWLTDDIIQFYYQLLSLKIVHQNSKVLLMNPVFS